jgi:DNA adenine methylase
MTKEKLTPFVKWAGGKKQLLDKLKARLPKSYNKYYEPFIGGGALLLALQPEHAVINDVNEQLLNIYRQLKEAPEVVINAVNILDTTPCDSTRYMTTRALFNAKITSHELSAQCAALMIWINKHCFNGLYRVNSKGAFNVPFNNRTTGMSIAADNLRNIGQYLKTNDIEIRQGDFELACADAQPGDLVYFDSPYVPASETANFTDYTKEGFTLHDHKRLASLFRELSQRGVLLMLSNNDVPLIHELYDGFRIGQIDARRAINRDATKRHGQEVIITNY